MFYYLNGKLEILNINTAVIDCNGVGYQLTVSGTTQAKLSGSVGQVTRLYTYLAVREDGVELFGFHSVEELGAFKMLISVSGVGPKAAMAILSIMTPERFALAVSTEDTKALSKASGVGAKSAARIVLELKDKIAKEIKTDNSGITLDEVADTSTGKLGDAINSLMVLGYSRGEAMTAIKKLDADTLTLEGIIKEALKILMKK